MSDELTRDEVERLLAEAAQSAKSQWEPSDADALWMLHGRDLATALLAAWDRAEAAEAERDQLRAALATLYQAAMVATDEYPDTETRQQQQAHHGLVDALYSDAMSAALGEVSDG